MPYIPPEVVAKAKEMDLLTYLKNYEPQELVHVGGSTYCTREHDSLKKPGGKFCVSDIRQNQEYHIVNVLTWAYSPCLPLSR